MNPINHESTARRTLNIGRGLALFRNGRGSRLLVAAALWIGMACATSYAQTVIGSPGAGFRHWTVGDLNNNGAPYWDAVTKSAGNTPNSANVGFCLTGTGDCGGSSATRPGRSRSGECPSIQARTPLAQARWTARSIFATVPLSTRN